MNEEVCNQEVDLVCSDKPMTECREVQFQVSTLWSPLTDGRGIFFKPVCFQGGVGGGVHRGGRRGVRPSRGTSLPAGAEGGKGGGGLNIFGYSGFGLMLPSQLSAALVF